METPLLPPTDYVDTPDELLRFCNHLSGLPWISVDTEFMRERTYYPVPCLLQIATPHRVACIDTLALPDLTPLQPFFTRSSLLKIFHSGRQDIEVLRNLWGESPSPIFDTQIAAALTGRPDQIGYAALIETLFGLKLDKQHTRTDWSRRPLSPEQIQYAAEDVLYLGEAYRMLSADLERLDRSNWQAEECAALLNPSLYDNAPEAAWRRIRAAPHLPPGPLAALQALAAWREITAQTRNLPRTWLLKDEQLCALAQIDPARLNDPGLLPGLDAANQKRHGKVLQALIRSAHDTLTPDPTHPSTLQTPLMTPEQKSLLKRLTAVIQSLALRLNIPATLLASRKDLEKLLFDRDQPSRLQRGWRKSVLGNTLHDILDAD